MTKDAFRVEFSTLYRDGREIWFRAYTFSNHNARELAEDYAEDLQDFHKKVRIVKMIVSEEAVV